MADQPKNQKTTKKGSDKEQPATVVLTADELRAIAGGAGGVVSSNPGSPNPTPKGMIKETIPGK